MNSAPLGDPSDCMPSIPSVFTPFVQQGWQCPCCHRCYSPTTAMCFYCPQAGAVTTVGSTAEGKSAALPINEGESK